MRISLALILLGCLLGGCAASPLSSRELQKIDPRLRPLVQGDAAGTSGECSRVTLADGSTKYQVIIRGDADELRAAGIPCNSAFGKILTASVNAEELATIARLPGVQSIECGNVNTTQ